MAINTTCPNCAAPHAKKLSIIYKEGLSTLQMTSESKGTGKTNNIIRTKITTATVSAGTGVQQSQLSQDSAPPAMQPLAKSAGAKKNMM